MINKSCRWVPLVNSSCRWLPLIKKIMTVCIRYPPSRVPSIMISLLKVPTIMAKPKLEWTGDLSL